MASDTFDFESYTDLTNTQLAGIGFASVAWNGIEVGLSALIWELAQWTREIGLFVTTDLGNVGKTELLTNLVNYVIDEPTLKDECLDVAIFFNDLRVRRNNIIHSTLKPGLSDRDPPSLVKRSAKSASGAIIETVIDADEKTLRFLASDMQLCLDAIPQVFRKVWGLHFYRSHHREPDRTTVTEFIHSSDFPSDKIAQLKTRVATLFPQRHTRRNKARQPPPSRE